MTKHMETAHALRGRTDVHFNCCQSVLVSFAADLGLTEENRDQSIEELVDEVYGKRWNVTNVPQYFSRQTLVDAIHYLDVYAAERA